MAPVEVGGPDSVGFLHAQLTSDVAALSAGAVSLSAWCNPRGQVRNLFWIVRRRGDDAFSLVVPETEADRLAHGLRAFVLRSKVEVARGADRVLGVAGSGAEAFVRGHVGSVPPPGGSAESSGRIAIRPSGDPHRYLVLGPDPLPCGLPQDAWRRIEIEAGIAWLTDESRESFIPQMLDLERFGALSFAKGCFPGQEVIARTRYLGRLKRRLYRGRTAAGERPAPGESIRSGGRLAGQIVASERTTDGNAYDLLAVLRIESAGTRLEMEDGRRFLPTREG